MEALNLSRPIQELLFKYFFFQLGDRIIHSFFQPDHYSEEDCDRLEFHDFIKVLAHFRPLKKEKHGQRNILNSRRDKLKSKFFHFNPL